MHRAGPASGRPEEEAIVQEALGTPGEAPRIVVVGAAARDIVSLNAGASIYVAGLVPTLAAGVEKAQAVIASGAARRKLDQFVAHTRSHG